jgi:hypothetical protein
MIDHYARPVTVAELRQELGIDAGDIEGDDRCSACECRRELTTAAQTADLLDVLDAKVRRRR